MMMMLATSLSNIKCLIGIGTRKLQLNIAFLMLILILAFRYSYWYNEHIMEVFYVIPIIVIACVLVFYKHTITLVATEQ